MTQTPNPALETLLSRRSAWPLTEPSPNPFELQTILQAAAHAPDHAGLRPWRFKIVQGDNRQTLLEQVLTHPDAQTEDAKAYSGKYTLKLTTAPLIIVLAAHITPSPKAPEFEQILSAGAAAMNMLNAAWALGYSGFWSSTLSPLDHLLHQVMGFESQDRIIGLLNLGTPSRNAKAPAERAKPENYAQIWTPN